MAAPGQGREAKPPGDSTPPANARNGLCPALIIKNVRGLLQQRSILKLLAAILWRMGQAENELVEQQPWIVGCAAFDGGIDLLSSLQQRPELGLV